MAMPKKIIFHGNLTPEDVKNAKAIILNNFLASYSKEDQDNIKKLLIEKGIIEAATK